MRMAKASESTLTPRRTQRVQHATGLYSSSFFSLGRVLRAVLFLAVVGSDAFQLTNQHTMQPLSLFSHSQAQQPRQEKQLAKIQDRDWLLQMNEQLQLTEIGALDRNKIDFLHIMNAWGKIQTTQGAEMVQMWLQRIEKEVEMGNKSVILGRSVFSIAIDAWVHSGDRKAASKSEEILKKMEQLYKLGNQDCQPNLYTYSLLIHAWEKSGESGSATRAEQILLAMEQQCLDDIASYGKPNTEVMCNTVINMYNAVISAWAKSEEKESSSRAEQILLNMENRFAEGANFLKPNTVTYSSVINALAKSGEPGAAEKAEVILQNMIDRYQIYGDEDVKPNTISFTTVIDAWARSGEKGAVFRAEKILLQMENLYSLGYKDAQPNVNTYSTLINAWSKSGEKGSASRAEQILGEMERRFIEGEYHLKPNIFTYNAVMNALANSGEPDAAERAESVLRSMLELRHVEGNENDVKPNIISFTTAINAWAKSGKRNAAPKAEGILVLMQQKCASGMLDIQPDARAYTAVINACAQTKHKEDRTEALSIAFRMFKQMNSSKDIFPNAFTYSILLSACDRLLPKEDEESRFSVAKALFERCCKAGFVNDYVLNKLRKTVNTTKRYVHLVGSVECRACRLPENWTRNVLGSGGDGKQLVGAQMK